MRDKCPGRGSPAMTTVKVVVVPQMLVEHFVLESLCERSANLMLFHPPNGLPIPR